MHVLILAYHYPPDRAVGSLRPARMAEAFRSRGHRVTVITAKLPGEVQPIRPAPAGMATFAVAPIPSPREWYLIAKKLVTRARRSRGAVPPAADDATETPRAAEVVGPLWKRSILSLLWLPDDRQGFVPAAVARAMSVHRRQPVDLLVTTAPPFSTHIAGLAIRRMTGARWAADFRDPWTDNPWKPAAVRTSFTDGVEARLERRVLKQADLVVSASDGIQRFFEKVGVAQAKLLVVRNGIEQVGSRLQRADAAFRILHMGTFYHGRDPRPFLEALARVRGSAGPAGPAVRVSFVGTSREFRGQSIPAMVAELGLSDVVEFHDFMPRDQVIAMASESDLLLLLAQNQPDQVPQKLYEYLGTRVPILAFADEGGESAKLLQEVGGNHVVTGGDVDAAVETLGAAMSAPRGVPAGDLAKLTDLTVNIQLRRLMDALGA